MPTLADLAARIHDGRRAESEVEDLLDIIWPDLVHGIATDEYDNSLEVYFTQDAPGDLNVSESVAREILRWGFDRFWLNFTDGTEQAVGRDPLNNTLTLGERRTVANPKWSVEQARA